jgi:hypothetical protein
VTTAAYRDGLMVADTRAYGFDRVPVGRKTKIARLDDGRLLCVSTRHIGQPALVLAWVRAGMDPDDRPELDQTCEVLLVHPDGEADLMDDKLNPARVSAPYYAIGSGKEFAMAAMRLGHGPVEAVAASCGLDPWTDFPLAGFTHDGEAVFKRGFEEATGK